MAHTFISPAVSVGGIDPATLFAKAHKLESEGRYDEAFAAFERANALKRSPRAAEYAADHALLVENLKWLFGPETFARPLSGNQTRAPIFIVGLPRSGSTLVEQILATHSKVQGMGEITRFRDLAARRYPFLGPPPGPRHFEHLSTEYLSGIRALGWKASPRFTDKQLTNYMFIGSIHLPFPNAIILHCVRDPLDTCLSCFRANFTDPESFYFDLADIGASYVRYRRIMDHWEKMLPARLVTIEHEALVTDFPNQAKRLVEACNLTWEERCLRFHENSRPVSTLSRDQVKRPIFHDSIGRWRLYKQHLGPLIEALLVPTLSKKLSKSHWNDATLTI